jgi:hypothetical protein
MILRDPLGIECRVCITILLLLSEGAEMYHDILKDLINALPGSVNMAKHATIGEAAFSVDPTNVPVDWLVSGHVICVNCRSMSIMRLYK